MAMRVVLLSWWPRASGDDGRQPLEANAHAPHCWALFTVCEMKRLGRDAAELTALADHIIAHGLVPEVLAGPLPGIHDPTGPGKLLLPDTRHRTVRRTHGTGPRCDRTRTCPARRAPAGRSSASWAR